MSKYRVFNPAKIAFGLLFILSIVWQTVDAGTIRKRKIKKIFKHAAIFKQHFTGFELYDIDRQKVVFSLNPSLYFIPASNTKLYTFYTCLKMLGDMVPGLQYVTRADSLIFWATGDPTFLRNDFPASGAFNLLKQWPGSLYFAAGRYTGNFYGYSWPYNDYNDDYQAEISELPVQGNLAEVSVVPNGQLQIAPTVFRQRLISDSLFRQGRFEVKRSLFENEFRYPAKAIPANFRQQVPWKTSAQLSVDILADTLKRPIELIQMPITADAKTIYSANADSVYKKMLQPSDNFIAEQLLLVCSATRFKVLNADSVIDYSVKNFMADMPDQPHWVDGSGLSRQNLFTPRTIIALLLKIEQQINNDELLHSLLPAGGVAGTIKNAYKTDNGKPFVWAKTGSLNGDYNQSGYLLTRKGKRLAFAFMNNNFTQPVREVRDEMVRILTFIHENY